jgi:hypothetical protein
MHRSSMLSLQWFHQASAFPNHRQIYLCLGVDLAPGVLELFSVTACHSPSTWRWKYGLYNLSGWWFQPIPSEKYEFVSSDADIPNIWKVKKIHGSKPPTRYFFALTSPKALKMGWPNDLFCSWQRTELSKWNALRTSSHSKIPYIIYYICIFYMANL